MKLIFTFLILALAQTQAKIYKICVPLHSMDACRAMVQVETKSKVMLECVAARDRMDCLWFVQQRQADLVPVEPEDMYVASKIPNEDFVVLTEYRSREDRDAEFRYEAVMVIRNSLSVNSVKQLKGLKSCHTGINRNVGYKIPLTMLMKFDNFPLMNDPTISPKENELKALSKFFSRSCIVGQWSPDPKINTVWKNRYANLCSMCEHPDKCDYPDNYSGYEGALKCLAHNNGDIAFTKVQYVKKFFGLTSDTSSKDTKVNADDYVYLCADGTKVPVKNKPCSWAARPWPGLIAHNDIRATLNPIRQKIRQLAEIGEGKAEHPWYTSVLGLSEKASLVIDNIPTRPKEYLDKANYTAVIERGHGAPEPVVRLCVVTNVALTKCRALSTFAFSRDIRPTLDCIQAASADDCLQKVRDDGADLAIVDGIKIGQAIKKYNLHPVFHEVYGKEKLPPYAVAVVKRGSGITDLEGLRGKKSCHARFGTYEGLEAPVYALILNNITQPQQCPRLRYIAQFFGGGSCLPGVDKLENNPTGESIQRLMKQCVRDPALNEPEECLKSGRGDVAFMNSMELYNLDASAYQLLCINKPEGGVNELNMYATCHIAIAPLRAWVASKDKISNESIGHTPLSLVQFLETRPELFNIYGEYLKNDNVIFNNHATGFSTTENIDYMKLRSIHDANNFCQILQ